MLPGPHRPLLFNAEGGDGKRRGLYRPFGGTLRARAGHFLADAGADVQRADDWGRTALSYASGKPSCEQLLRQHGLQDAERPLFQQPCTSKRKAKRKGKVWPNDPAKVAVESLRGLQKGIFSGGTIERVMIVHALLESVREAMVALRKRNRCCRDVCLVQLRGHDWTLVDACEDLLDLDVMSDAGAGELSRELGSEVVYMLTDDTSGTIEGRIFHAGATRLKMGNDEGVRFKSDHYEPPPQKALDEEWPELDVKGHIAHYLGTHGTYLSEIYWQSEPNPQVELPGLKASDLARVEYLPYE